MTSRRSHRITGSIHETLDHVMNLHVEIDEDGVRRFLVNYRTLSTAPVQVAAFASGGRD
jgi:hypothetical protein